MNAKVPIKTILSQKIAEKAMPILLDCSPLKNCQNPDFFSDILENGILACLSHAILIWEVWCSSVSTGHNI